MALSDLIAHYWAPIAPLLQLDGVNDIFIDRFDRIYYSRAGQYVAHDGIAWPSEDAFFNAASVLVGNVNHTVLSRDSPIADARFDDGARVSIHAPPLVAHTSATIRVARPRAMTLQELADTMFPVDMQAWLEQLLVDRRSILISGATDSGKTTLLRALLNTRVHEERMFIVEDTAELKLQLHRGVAHEITRDNAARISMADSIRSALRFAPQRIVVGELRTADAIEAYLKAFQAGFGGVTSTIHAHSAVGALTRMETELASKQLFNTPEHYRLMVRSNVNAVLHCQLGTDGVRRVIEACALHGDMPWLLWQYDTSDNDWYFDHGAMARVQQAD